MVLELSTMEDTLKRTFKAKGQLERATLMGGESTILENLPDYIKVVKKYAGRICLVTNGKPLNEKKLTEYKEAGLDEIAISISSKENFLELKERILLAKKLIEGVRINIPRSFESTDESLFELLDTFGELKIFSVVCEDLFGRYGEPYGKEYFNKYGAEFIKNDGFNFELYKYNQYTFGVFTNFKGYNDSDIIITPIGNFSHWDDYCKEIGSNI